MIDMMPHNTQTYPKENRRLVREGSRDNPYPLHWPAAWYKRAGKGIGLDFTGDEIRHAKENGGVLGVKRYKPSREALVALKIPAGSYVKCYVH